MRQLKSAFGETGETEFKELIVVAQQRYLCLETVEKPFQVLPGLVPIRFARRRGDRKQPLARMVWTGDPTDWGLQLYKCQTNAGMRRTTLERWAVRPGNA